LTGQGEGQNGDKMKMLHKKSVGGYPLFGKRGDEEGARRKNEKLLFTQRKKVGVLSARRSRAKAKKILCGEKVHRRGLGVRKSRRGSLAHRFTRKHHAQNRDMQENRQPGRPEWEKNQHQAKKIGGVYQKKPPKPNRGEVGKEY